MLIRLIDCSIGKGGGDRVRRSVDGGVGGDGVGGGGMLYSPLLLW